MQFERSEQVAEVARNAADEFVEMVHNTAHVELDFGVASVRAVDRIASSMHRSLPPESARDEAFERALERYSDQIGAYLGEVIRRLVGGMWGHGIDEGERFVALYTTGGTLLWPAGRAYKRIVEGGDDDLWDYVSLFAPSGAAAGMRLGRADHGAADGLESFRVDDSAKR